LVAGKLFYNHLNAFGIPGRMMPVNLLVGMAANLNLQKKPSAEISWKME
jgi:hypothetical protein